MFLRIFSLCVASPVTAWAAEQVAARAPNGRIDCGRFELTLDCDCYRLLPRK